MISCSGEDELQREPTLVETYMADGEAIARGEAIFAGTCSGFCHSRTETDTDALFLFDCEWKHGGSDQDIYEVTTNGVPDTRMVAYGNNFPEADDLWKVIAFLRVNQEDCG